MIVPLADYPDYGVTREGRVFRIRQARFGRTVPHELAIVRRNGYASVGLTPAPGEESRARKVHRLVAQTFLPPPPRPGLDVAHKNGCRTDNRVENLYWATRKENMADAAAHGTQCRGETTGTSKLTEPEVIEIRTRVRRGEAQARLVEDFNVSPTAISQIVNRKRWLHVQRRPYVSRPRETLTQRRVSLVRVPRLYSDVGGH